MPYSYCYGLIVHEGLLIHGHGSNKVDEENVDDDLLSSRVPEKDSRLDRVESRRSNDETQCVILFPRVPEYIKPV